MDNFGPPFMIINTTTTVHDHRSPALPSDWWRFLPPGIPTRLTLVQQNHGGTLAGDDVGSTLGRSSAVPRNSGSQFPVYSPEPLRWWFHPGFDGLGFPSGQMIDRAPAVDRGGGSSVHDHDHYDAVDTTLTLSLPGSPRNPNPAVSAADSNVVGFPIESGDDVVDFPIKGGDEVDTELSLGLFLPNGKKEEPTKPKETEERGKSHGGAGDVRTEEKKVTEKKKRKVPDAGAGDGAAEEKKREQPKRRRRNDEDQRPLIPIEGIPVLYQTLESRGGTGPVFLYRKKLTHSDVKKDQNRLLVTRTVWTEKLMKFLSEKEAAAVNGGNGGVKTVGIDCEGRVHEEMGLTKWGKVTVFNSAWRPMFEAIGAERGQVVEVWGYRENGKPCFAFNFREDQP